MCNSARRQERVCKAQRPAAKIDAIATQPAAETARPAFEPAGRLVDLNLAVFMCNSVARQERVCRAQRPAAKIDAIATSASGRDRTSAFEPAETPANCGLFLRDRETSVRIGLRGGGCSPDRTCLGCQMPIYQGKEPGIL